MGEKELLEDPWTLWLSILRGPCTVDHVVHLVEHMEVGVLPEMIRWPFSWVPEFGEIVFSCGESCISTWYETHLQDLSGQSMVHQLQH